MSTSALTSHTLPASAPAAAHAVFRLLKNLRHGSLDVQLPDGSQMHFGEAGEDSLRAAVRLLNWNVCSASLRSGDIGFAEAFIAGDWTSPDPAALIKLMLANAAEVESLVYGTWWGSLLYRVKHWLNRNSRAVHSASAPQPQPISSTRSPGLTSHSTSARRTLAHWASAIGRLRSPSNHALE